MTTLTAFLLAPVANAGSIGEQMKAQAMARLEEIRQSVGEDGKPREMGMSSSSARAAGVQPQLISILPPVTPPPAMCKAATCGGEILSTDTQCCVKDANTGKDKQVEKQATKEDPKFDWAVYKQQCIRMKQSQAPADALWPQCVVKKPHTSTDAWSVTEVISNGIGRSYCIDGCSTPPDKVHTLFKSGVFIFEDKDNPTGAGPGGYGDKSSFYGSCAAHDKCYQTCDGNDQKTCDDKLKDDMLRVCNDISVDHKTTYTNNLDRKVSANTKSKCEAAAYAMYAGLRLPLDASRAAFKTRRQQYCQCC